MNGSAYPDYQHKEKEVKVKPPKTIYLQWDEEPGSENTWCEEQINDDDIKYIRPNHDALARQLAAYEVGVDPNIELPTESQWVLAVRYDRSSPVFYYYCKESGKWTGEDLKSCEAKDFLKWFPRPGKLWEEDI